MEKGGPLFIVIRAHFIWPTGSHLRVINQAHTYTHKHTHTHTHTHRGRCTRNLWFQIINYIYLLLQPQVLTYLHVRIVDTKSFYYLWYRRNLGKLIAHACSSRLKPNSQNDYCHHSFDLLHQEPTATFKAISL